jgi:glutathione S-transferase
MTEAVLHARSSSHYARTVRIVARELGVPLRFVPVYDMTELAPAAYAGNPAMKVPCLHLGGEPVFGTENICRTLARASGRGAQVTWPEQLADITCGNAQELVWHCMAAQVQVVFGTVLARLPPDNIYFAKARAGFEGSLAWLDEHLARVLALLPPQRTLSLFEVTLYCLVDHLSFRQTVSLDGRDALLRFREQWGERESARATPYRLDLKP